MFVYVKSHPFFQKSQANAYLAHLGVFLSAKVVFQPKNRFAFIIQKKSRILIHYDTAAMCQASSGSRL